MTYISTARCDDLGKELASILEKSRRNNALSALTGVLLVSGGSFYQTLEGDKDEVVATFARIGKDYRHDGLIVLQEEATSHRAFAGWSMAHRDLPPNHEIAGKIAQIAAGEDPAFRTRAAASDMDILITSFLTV